MCVEELEGESVKRGRRDKDGVEEWWEWRRVGEARSGGENSFTTWPWRAPQVQVTNTMRAAAEAPCSPPPLRPPP